VARLTVLRMPLGHHAAHGVPDEAGPLAAGHSSVSRHVNRITQLRIRVVRTTTNRPRSYRTRLIHLAGRIQRRRACRSGDPGAVRAALFPLWLSARGDDAGVWSG